MTSDILGSGVELEKAGDPLRPLSRDAQSSPGTGLTFSKVKAFLTPEILQSRSNAPRRVRSTAYLDGIRGLAAAVVYLAHNILSANGLLVPIEVAWGFEGQNYNLVNFPFLRILFTGSHASVPIFFIISGYVQSRKTLQLIHENDVAVYTTIASGLFRRGFRLLVPVLGTSFFFMTLWHVLHIQPYMGQYEETYLLDLKYFFKFTWYFTYIFKSIDVIIDKKHTAQQWFAYNGHTWTVPLELQGSFLVLIFLFVYAKATTKVRTTVMAFTSFYLLAEGGVYFFCFPFGAVLCELDMLSAPDAFLISSKFPYRKYCLWLLLLLGLYLGGVPVRGFAMMSPTLLAEQPGFYYVSYLCPEFYFDVTHYLGTLSAICIVTAVIGLPGTHKFFESRLLQYFGRISFSLYLCHGPILSTLGIFLYRIVGKITDPVTAYDGTFVIPQAGPRGIDLAFWTAFLAAMPITLYASELCLKLFDIPSIRLAQWLWKMASTEG